MTHSIFSSTLNFENADSKLHIRPVRIEEIEKIKRQKGTDIYLCGGEQLAGWPSWATTRSISKKLNLIP
jgi:hypothetical protein